MTLAYLTRDQYLQQLAERGSAKSNKQYVSYFGLKDDGEEAVVRFAYSDPSQFDVYTVHPVTIDGKFRKVNCLRGYHDPVEKCPLCEAGEPVQNKIYIKLIKYERSKDDNSINLVPCVWERPASYMTILNNLFSEYGDISDCVFKIRRSGERGSLQTTYSIMFANPSVYNSQLYKKDFSAFEDYNVLGTAVLDKSYKEIVTDILGGEDDSVEEEATAPRVNPTQEEQPISSGPKRITY